MTVEEIEDWVVRGGILDAAGFDAKRDQWAADAETGDGDSLLEFLRAEGVLTALQVRFLRSDRANDLDVGPYRLIDEIAVGRLGRTFHAVHREFEQPVCLKVFPASLTDDPDQARRLARETRVAIQVDDPHVVRTFQVGHVGRFVFLVLERLEGETLASRLRREGRLPFLESCRIARHAALGLAHLHDREIVHRDLQPRSIWLHDDGRALLTEFAAARDALEFLDAVPARRGGGFAFRDEELANYDFLSAEQGLDADLADERSDLYSLGCVLFRCLTGRVVFPTPNPVRKMLQHALVPAPCASELETLPVGVDAVLEMLLEKSPDDRYQRATDVAWALEQLIASDVGKAVATAEVNEDFVEWANTMPELRADEGDAGLVADRDFLDFLGFLVEHQDDEERDGGEHGSREGSPG